MAARGLRLLIPFLLLASALLPRLGASAEKAHPSSAGELINAVNNLRLSNGLPTLSEHPILMQVAQGQADALLATEGEVGHSRPNGITFTQQLLLLGYPLSGDLSLGGYRSENFIFGYQLSAEAAVEAWKGDDPHLNTMLSENRSDIGAGAAVAADGTTYYVIDTALRTSSGLPQSDAELYLPGGSGAGVDPELAISQYIVPIVTSTARPDGNVYHTVQYGQTLWGIAIEYGTKIDRIRALNHLAGTTVYPNQLLLVMQGATQPAPPPTILPAIATVGAGRATGSSGREIADGLAPTRPPESQNTAREDPSPVSSRAPSLSFWVAVMILLLLGGGFGAAWFIRDPDK